MLSQLSSWAEQHLLKRDSRTASAQIYKSQEAWVAECPKNSEFNLKDPQTKRLSTSAC